MTGAEWLASTDVMAMLGFLKGKTSDRKLRLFAVACYRQTIGVESAARLDAAPTPDEIWQQALIAEQVADGLASNPMSELDHYYGYYSIFHDSGSSGERAAHSTLSPSAWKAATEVVKSFDDGDWEDGDANVGVNCMRDSFNPFYSPTFDPAWRTSTVVAVAQAVYDDRAFDRLPILADALQDAGCEDAAILGHLRGDGPHVRGCWALDLVLGKQ